DDRLHAGIRAPQGDAEPENETEPKLGVALGGEAGHLFANDVDGTCGQKTGGGREVIVDRRRLRKQPVQRDKSGKRRKQGEQAIKHNAGGDREQPVFADLLIDAPKNILPSAPGDLPGRVGTAAPPRLMRARVLQRFGLVATAGGGERPGGWLARKLAGP